MRQTLPLVGRQAELAELRRQMAAAAAGTGSLVLLEGRAGIGKSALVQMVCAGDGSLLPGVGYCPGPEETLPFGPWVEALAHLARMACRDTAALPPPFGHAPDLWSAAEVAGEVAAWLGALGRPALVVLEDVQWADSASLDLLRRLPPLLRAHPVLVLATCRSEEVHESHPLWALLPQMQRAGAVRLALGPLGEGDVAELVRAVVPEGSAVAPLARALHRRSGGHPLFMRELLLAAAEAGAVGDPAGVGGIVHPVRLETMPLPRTLQQAIDLSLARLSPGTEQMLQVAALIGEMFTYDVLAAAAELPEDALATALAEALALRVIRAAGTGGEQFAFDHALVREALAARLLAPQRRCVHRRVAEHLLAAPQPDVNLVALHLRRARDPRAAHYLLLAGDRALHLGALKQARERYQQALALVGTGEPRRGELLLKLGHTLEPTDPRQAAALWEEAATAATATMDRPASVWAGYHRAVRMWCDGDRRCLEVMDRVQAEQEEILADARYQKLESDLFGGHPGYPRMAGPRAEALIAAGRLDEARELVAAMQARARPGLHRAYLQNAELALAWLSGQVDDAAALCRRMVADRLQLRKYTSAVFLEVVRLSMLSSYRADAPDELDAAWAEAEKLQAHARARAGCTYMDGFSPRGILQFWRGDWEGARRNLVEYVEHHPHDPVYALHHEAARLQLALGDLAGAHATLARVPPLEPEDEPGFGTAAQVMIQSLRARVHLARGEPAQARCWLESADRWLERIAIIPDRPCHRLAWAEFHRQTGNIRAARDAARQALEFAAGLHDCTQIIAAHRLLGQLGAVRTEAAGAGAHAPAVGADEHFTASLALAQRCRLPYEAALTQLARARTLPGAPGARAGLAAARETFARLGAVPALAEAEALLAAGSQEGARPDGLTDRELEVVRLVALGLTDKEVAARLHISRNTVDSHVRKIYGKLEVRNRAALVAYAIRQGLAD